MCEDKCNRDGKYIEAAGAVICSRGVIKITDLEAVKAMACQCYETFREQTS